MQRFADEQRARGKRIAFVPTMGALHEGHQSLIRTARDVSDCVVTSVFVNPLQFGPGEDFERYPRDLNRDQRVAFEAGTDVVFVPTVDDLYPDGFVTKITLPGELTILEGEHRPGHFEGVATIVSKLFNIVKPHVAVFGQKDAQQAFIIARMARDLNFDVEVTVAPTVRESDGLAMSSRNVYLSAEDRKRAHVLYRSLKQADQLIHDGERSASSLRRKTEDLIRSAGPTAIDYVACVDPATFRQIEMIAPPAVLVALAVRFGSTRLIDNAVISVSE